MERREQVLHVDGDGWKSLVPKQVLLQAFGEAAEGRQTNVCAGEKLCGAGVALSRASVVCVASEEDEALEFCADVAASNSPSSLLELCERVAQCLAQSRASVCALICAARREQDGFVVLAVRSGSLAGRMWMLDDSARELLENVPRRMGRMVSSGMWMSFCLMERQPTLFVCSPELVFATGDFGSVLQEAAKERDPMGHFLASSNDGFGGGATIVLWRPDSWASASPHHEFHEFVVAHAVTRAARARTVAQQCDGALRVMGVNTPLAIGLSQTSSQLVLMCQTLSSGTLAVSSSDGASLNVSMTFPDEQQVAVPRSTSSNSLGEAEFYGPVSRVVDLPLKIDAESKILVYDRNDGIVTVKYDIVN
jgi:hypothetical protein